MTVGHLKCAEKRRAEVMSCDLGEYEKERFYKHLLFAS